MHNPAILTALTAALAVLPGTYGFYTKTSPVLQVTAKTYDKLIAKSGYTSIVEFYAPWCGHCQNLKPAYEKAAKQLDGLAKVAAVDCDDADNQPLCSAMGIKGFPTLKIVRPSKTGGQPVVEDYQGQRTTNAIVEAVASKINNYVTRVADKDLDEFLEGDKPKAILFSEKGTTSALIRSIAIDFLDVISVAQIRSKEKSAVEKFGITKFPTLVLIPGEGKETVVYEGELKKKEMVEFLSQAGTPKTDSAPTNGKAKKEAKKDKKKDKKEKKSTESAEEKQSTTQEPEESTSSETVAAATDIPIATITTEEKLIQECLSKGSHTCVLVFAPEQGSETGEHAVAALSHLNTKYIQGKRHLFPFFSIPSESEAASTLPGQLELKGEVNMIAINSRRSWWKQYEGDFSLQSVESWIDAIRMGEGAKKKLPKDVLSAPAETEESASEPTQATDPEPEVETEATKPEADTQVPKVDVEEEATEASTEAETAVPEPEAEPEAEPETAASDTEEKIVHEDL